MKASKRKIVYLVHGEGVVHGVFNTRREASEFAQGHNLEHGNWKSINTKWFSQGVYPEDVAGFQA